MVTVWTMCTGDKYPLSYVTRLQREVAKYLTIPHKFKCITEHDVPGVECVDPPTPYPGWFGKIGLFKKGFADETNVWLDLDVVITGNLDEMVLRYCRTNLAILTNWAQSGHGGCQSSVMMWRPNHNAYQIYDLFDYEVDSKRLHGDQEFITELRDTDRIQPIPIEAHYTASYKYHVRGKGVPDGCKIVIFHGKPDPSEVKESWFQW